MSNPSLAADQLLELLLQLKKTTPAAAKQILNSQPQIAYALITLMVSMNAVNFEVFQKILADYSAGLTVGATPVPSLPPHMQNTTQYRTTTPPQPYPNGNYAPGPSNYPAYAPPVATPSYPAPTATPTASVLPESLASLPDDQKAMVVQLLSMTPEQINMLGPNERNSILQLKATLGLP